MLSRWLVAGMVVCGVAFLAVSAGSYADTPTPNAVTYFTPAVAPVAKPVMPETQAPTVVPRPVVERVGVEPAIRIQAAPAEEIANALTTVEAPDRLSMDRLRRQAYRYPDRDEVSRFAELNTELPPLFD